MTPRLQTALLALTMSMSALASAPAAHAAPLQDHPGFWLGDMKTPDSRTLKIGAELFARADGSAWASVASPDQGAYDIPVKAIVHEADGGDVLDMGFGALKLTWSGNGFDGEWRQGKTPVKFTLHPVAEFPKPVRPQTPHAPFPYREETLAIPSVDGVTLGATLSIPPGVNKPNVVVLVHGSGPGTRHEEIFGHRAFDVLADDLARHGVAVLRYDKRGIARSTGDYDGHVATQLAQDVAAVVATLRARGKFGRIGVAGLSEGSQIAAAAAARAPGAIDFLVSLSGVGTAGLDLMLAQDRIWALDHGADAAALTRVMPYVAAYYKTVLATPDGAPRIAALQALYAGLSTPDQALIVRLHMNEGTLSPAMAAKPFLPASLAIDPRTDWRRVRCPVLVLGGALDHQVPAAENVEGIVTALHAGGNRHVESAVIPSLNHLLQTARTGQEDEYTRIDETMATLVLQRVSAFARRH